MITIHPRLVSWRFVPSLIQAPCLIVAAPAVHPDVHPTDLAQLSGPDLTRTLHSTSPFT